MRRDPVKPKEPRIWENGFDGHADAQLLRLAALSFREKVEWLEAMQKRIARIRPVGSGSVFRLFRLIL